MDEKNLNQKNSYRRESSGRKNDSKAQGRRSGSIDSGGFYLKMVFPISLGSKKKKKNETLTSNSAKVSPRPSVSDGSAKGVVDKEWLNKSLSASVETDGGASSSNTGSLKSSGSSSSSCSSISNSRHEKIGGGCLAFIRKPRFLTQK
ncbi:hypothetical protein L6164_016255 [Bauhinia variegata]|uniref:Uncharacterized protein n=1 Tax=Bauhinia variegata TaxID=167791 RepID=A0ACB9NN69_BAUVA|nr:hypothetical protein L6164_016255 [Bauhinia variegata]